MSGKGHEGCFQNDKNVSSSLYLEKIWVTWIYTYVKTYKSEHLKSVYFTVCKLYLSLFLKLQKELIAFLRGKIPKKKKKILREKFRTLENRSKAPKR